MVFFYVYILHDLEKYTKKSLIFDFNCDIFEMQLIYQINIIKILEENRKLKESDKDSILRDGEVSAKTVFDAVKEKDELAMEVAEEFGKYLGNALAVIAGVVNPDAIVIGGGVSKAGEVLMDYIKTYYEKNVFHGSRDVKFSLATLGNDAGIYGAAKLVLDI